MANPDPKVQAALEATWALVLPEVLTVETLARHLACSVPTARKLLRDGHLPGRRLGRRWYATRRGLLSALERDPGILRLAAIPGADSA